MKLYNKPIFMGALIGLSLFLFSFGAQAQTVDICDRTDKVETEILSVLGVTNCATVTSTQLAGITRLDLSFESISSLQSDDFDGLTSLETLDLRSTTLTSLPEDLFDGLTSLETLNLDNNSLTSLPEDLFDEPTSLEALYFQFNSLTSLPEDLFDGLTSLEYLHLGSNSLTSVSENLFDGLTSLEDLRLEGNSITRLPEDLFEGLTSLEILYLDTNSFTSVPEDLFEGLTSLERLSLTNNSFTSLPEDLFEGLTSLESLNLRGTSLTSLQEDLFEGLTSLEGLYLGSNSLTSVPEDLFEGLTSLEILWIEGALTSLQEDLFEGLTSLESLNLNGNSLTSLHANLFDHVTSPQTLIVNLRRNPISCFPSTIINNRQIHLGHPNSGISCTEGAPTVTLVLTPSSIGEDAKVSTVTATLNRASGVATTITISAVPVSPGLAADYTLSVNKTLAIAAGQTTSTGTVTITSVDNAVDAPNKTVTVKGDASTGVTDPSDVTLTITDDEASPTATLVLTPSSIGEDAKVSTVTATLDRASSAATTITVSAVPVSPALASDYTLSVNKALTIAAGQTTSTGVVTITSVDNAVDAPNKTVQVQGAATNTQGVTEPVAALLTITDDESPTATLVLTPSSIGEDAKMSTVTATLDLATSMETTITVSAAAVSPALAADYTLSVNKTLTIVAGQRTSTGTVTITSVDNTVDAPNKTVTVKGDASTGVTDPSDVTLTITDDEATPTAALLLSSNSISENAASTTVTATLNRASSAATTIVVSISPDAPATSSDYHPGANQTLTIAAGATTSTGTVTITSVDNTVDAPNKTVQVKGAATNTQGITNPDDVTLTITDDDATPTATLVLRPSFIGEDAKVITVTATLDRASSAATTITISAAPISPALAADYTLSVNKTLTIAAGQRTSTGGVTITSVDNAVDASNKRVTVKGVATNTQGITNPLDVDFIIIDDEDAPTATLVLTPSSIGEDAKVSTVTATLNRASSAATTITVSAAAVSPALASDYTLSVNKTLTIAAGQTTSTGVVTITSVDNAVDAPDKTVTVKGAATNRQGITNPGDVTLTITDDDDAPTATLLLTPSSIGEDAKVSTVTARLDRASGAATTITISSVPVSPAQAADFTLSVNKVLTIAAGQTTSTGVVTITSVDNAVDASDKAVTVKGAATNTQGVTAPSDQTLTITDDDDAPTATLVLTPSSIGEDVKVSTVTATLDRASSAATTITVSAAAVSPALASDLTLSVNKTLTIAAGQTTSTGVVTITSVDNAVDAPDKTVTVKGAATNTQGVTAPSDQTLTITDDEDAPTATLVLTPSSIGEDAKVSTVTATLDRASSAATTITVSAAGVSPALAADYTLSVNKVLTIAAGQTTSTGVVTITSVDNAVDGPNKTVTVKGAATNTQGVTAPLDQTLTITDDEDAPTATLVLTPSSIGEDAKVSTVTATLDRASSAATTITISALPVSPAQAADYTLSVNKVLTIAAGQTTSTGTVTITSVDNAVDAPDKTVTVKGAATNTQGVTSPSDQTLTITDDEDAPTATLVLTPSSIGEDAKVSTVTATLDRASSAATTITISAVPDAPAATPDFTLSVNKVLTIAAGQTTSAGVMTITSVDNAVDAPDKTVTVKGAATNTQGVTAPSDQTLTITDDEDAPTATLVLTPSSIGEDAKVSTVTATLDRASSATTTITVSAAAVSPALAADYTLSVNRVLTIAAGQTTSTGVVTITSVDNAVDALDKTVTVKGAATNTHGVTAPSDQTLTIADDDDAPTATLDLSSNSISENAASTTVTASLDRASGTATRIVVSVSPDTPATSSDYHLGANQTLTIAAGATTSTGVVTITSVDNAVDAPDKTVTVKGAATNTQGVTAPSDQTLTITDDEDAPTATLVLAPSSIGEDGESMAVTATLDRASSAATTITVSASAVSPALAADYTLSVNRTLTIVAGATTSTGVVTITSVNNQVDAPNKTVTVNGAATNTQGITNPDDVTLTITDDEAAPTVTLLLSSSLIGEDGERTTVTATLDRASSAATTITVSAAPDAPATTSDYTLSVNKTLTIVAGATTSTGVVTITSVDNAVNAPDKTVRVQGAATNTQGITNPSDVELTITDETPPPAVTLLLSSPTIGENAGSTTVTATLNRTSSTLTTITVSAAPDAPATASDYTLSVNRTLTIAAGAVTSTGVVTITSVNNEVDAPNKTVQVNGVATNTQGITNPGDVMLTITDDEASPTVTLLLSSSLIGEDGERTTVTATLNRASSAATTITVSAAPDAPATSSDYTLSQNTTLTIAAGAVTSTGVVTITSVDNEVNAPNKTVQVQGAATNTQGITNPSDVALAITDDEAAPTVTLVLAPSSIGENAGRTTVTATLDRASSAVTTITVSSVPDAPAVASDLALSGNTILTIVAGATSSTGVVTITSVNNEVDAPDKTVQVQGAATNTQGVTGPAAAQLTITDDDATPTVTFSLSPASISENAGRTTVAATLDRASSAVTTIVISALTNAPATASDITLSQNTILTIAAGAVTSTGVVTITAVDNQVSAPNKTVQVQGAATNTQGITNPSDVELAITDDDATPTVTFSLSPASISENAGQTTVTAVLNRPSGAETAIVVSAVANAPATASDITLSANTTLAIAAGATTSTGVVTITAVNNEVDAPNKTVQVQGAATNTQGVTGPAAAQLTITDDDATPTVTLVLTPASIGENAGRTTVTAALDHPSSAVTTIVVSAFANAPTTASDYTLSQNTILAIAAGDTESTGLVTITAVDNPVDAPNKTVRVQGAATNTRGVSVPADVVLTIIDDDETVPVVTLVLTPASIGENAGRTTVTAALDRPSTAETTIVVSVLANAPTTASDYTLSANATLSIAAGETVSTGVVTITAVDNTVSAPDKTVQVQGAATNAQGVTGPASALLTITDNEVAPTVTLALDSVSISENGGRASVTATLDRPSSDATTITVSVLPNAPATASDYMLSANATLSIAAGETESTGLVTITAVDNPVDAPNKTVRVQGATTNTHGVNVPADVVLTIIDDDETVPVVTLLLTPASILENAGRTTVTAALDHPSTAETTIVVSVRANAPTTASDYTLSQNTILSIAAGETVSTGVVTITAVDNTVSAPDKTVQVQGAATNAQGVTGPASALLTITDNEVAPTVTLALDPVSISENGGRASVTATLDRPSGDATTITVSVLPNALATASDYMLSANATLSIAAGETESTGLVTITAVNNPVDAPDKTVQVQGTASNAQGVTDPPDVELTITDDEEMPTLTLILDPASISENGGGTSVTATLDRASSDATMITVTALANAPATASDYTLSANATLSIAAGDTESTRLVTITAVDNEVDAPDKAVQVKGTASNTQGVTAPPDVELTITDDEAAPTLTLALDPASISENGGGTSVTATLDRPSSDATTITVSVLPNAPATASDYMLSANTTLAIAAGATTSTGLVTITAVNNEVDAPDKTVQVQGMAANSQGVTGPAAVVLTLTDDDESFPVARDVTVTAEEDMPYRFGVSDFGYSDAEGDPLAAVRIERHPDTGALTLGGTEFPVGTRVSTARISAGELVFTPVANAYGPTYTSFDFKVSDGKSESLLAATMTIDVTPANDAATGVPRILGSMQVGQELRVSTAEIMDIDGLGNAERGVAQYAYRYQWLRRQGSQSRPIAEGSTYVPVEADLGASLIVRVAFVDDAGFAEVLESPPRQVLHTRGIRQAWMGRLGRSVADQILDATRCDGRVNRAGRSEAYLAGQPLVNPSRALSSYLRIRQIKQDPVSTLLGAPPGYSIGHALTRDRLIQGSSFRQSGMLDSGEGISVWGRGAVSRFRGQEEVIRMDAQVNSGMLGADWIQDRGTLGVVIAHTRSGGGYEMSGDDGALSARLSGIYPNGCYALTSRVTVWAVAGYGRGELTLEQLSSPMNLLMAGGGAYGRIRMVARQRVEIGLRSDALIVRTSAQEIEELPQDAAQVTRLRLGLKGTMRGVRLRRATIAPAAEIALRHDGGDAETGFGLDMLVGLEMSAPDIGLRIEVRTRGVLTHQNRGLQEQGIAAAVNWHARPRSDQGFQIRLEQTMGGDVFGGTERLLRAKTIERHRGDQYDLQTGDLRIEAGYGFTALAGQIDLQPKVGLEWSRNQRRYETGWQLALNRNQPTKLNFFIGATGWETTARHLQIRYLTRLQIQRRF